MERVKLPPLKDQVAQALRGEIFAGRMQDGEELAQEDIAARLGVSRIPVREAFLLLETEGLLQRLPNRHVRVVGLTAQRLRQNFAVLAALEGELAALAAPTLQHTPLPDPAKDGEFHAAFAAALDNHTLMQLYTTQRHILFDGVLPASFPDERRTPLNQLILQTVASGADPRAAVRHYYDTMAEAAIKELAL